jgi:ketosteroid isomerase-like protein
MCARFDALASANKPNPFVELHAQRLEAFRRRDWPGLASIFSDDFVLVDKRPATGWPTLRGPTEMAAMWRDLFTIGPDVQPFFELVEGDDETAIFYYGLRGHANREDGGGEFEDMAGNVAVMRDGLLCYAEVFNPDDLEAMRARRVELRPLAHRRSGTGLRLEPFTAEHAALRLTDAIQARAWPTVDTLLDPGLVVLDRRPGSPIHARKGLLAHLRALADTACRYHVYAATDRATAGVLTAGGQVLGAVMLWAGDQCVRVQLFEPDDETSMRSRIEQLDPTADWGPATRGVQRYVDCLNARDIEGIRASYAEDFRLVDHRLASPLSGVLSGDEHSAAFEALFALASDARIRVDHLGELDGVYLGKAAWFGHQNQTGGEFEIPFRVVVIWNERCSRFELFDVEDERGALRAMSRLLAPRANDAAPVATDLVLGLTAAINDRDWERVKACLAPDLATVDHRRVRTLGLDRPGGQGFVERMHGLLSVAADAQPRVEPLAELPGTAMALIAWSGHLNDGGGPFEVRWRGVFAALDELIVRYELFDEDDEAGMLAALARLRAERATSLIAELYRRHSAAFNARDWTAMRAVWADDLVMVEQRPATGWPVLRGRAEAEAMMRHLLTMSPNLKFAYELVEGDDECAIVRYAVRGQATEADGGGELDLTATHVTVTRHGLICYMERHAAEVDIEILRARREEVRPLARRRPGIDLPPQPLASERALLRFIDVLDAGEWDTLADLLDPRFALVDHRRISVLGDEIRDRDAYLARERSLFESAVECTRRHYEVFAATDTACVVSMAVRGSMADGGGPFEIAVGVILEWRAARCARVQLFDADDEAGMLAALRRLQADEVAPPAQSENP